ncbi:MAG: transposase family protein [Caldilineaceae bacterium SB0662_bin_9]|uniref:Transposase family protein n=1 Tax=Caldilineaceae bacterium SB0662_bin_9 TaxID=2605258 RepID=A0A6B1DXS2_9CHLR|nr:transposase family protein [Caldilineaceae bacterium SB0662_bin_9]
MTTSSCAAVPPVDFLNEIEDPRMERARLPSRYDILATTFLAVICGAGSGADVELFGGCQHGCEPVARVVLEDQHRIASCR